MNNSSTQQLREFLLKNSQRKSYTVAISTILLVLIVFFMGVVPAINAISAQFVSNKAKIETISKLNNKVAILQSLFNDMTSKKDLITKFNESMPDDLQEEDVVKVVAEIAKQQGLNLQGINFNEIEKRRVLTQIFEVPNKIQGRYVNISISGDRDKFITFITELEKSERVFNIRNINIARQLNQQLLKFGPYVLSIRGEVYYWDQTVV